MTNRKSTARKRQNANGGYSDLERQVQDAAHLAGKSVPEWLRDVIEEQRTDAPSDVYQDDGAKFTVLNELVDRVRRLENTFDGNQTQSFANNQSGSLSSALDDAARDLNQNYDEKARALIDGIRARAQRTNQLPPNPPHVQIHPGAPSLHGAVAAPQDTNADRMMEMLGTLGYLEQQLKANLSQSNLGIPGSPAPMVSPMMPTAQAPAAPVTNNEDAERLARVETQLARMESHLNNSDDEPSFDDDREYRPKRKRRSVRETARSRPIGKAPILSKSSHGDSSRKQGNKQLRGVMDAIVDQHVNEHDDQLDTNQADNNSSHSGRQNSGRRETDQHFQTLMEKIDGLTTGSTDPDTIESLKQELAALKGEVTSASAQTSFAGQNIQDEVKRLRNIITAMQEKSIDTTLGSKLEALETDINRIAEFLLKSPDLSALPQDTSKLHHELNRVSDGLLAVIDRTDKASEQSGNFVVSRLQQDLAGLRSDIVSNLQSSNLPVTIATSVSSSLENRLSALQSEFDASLGSLKGEVAGLGSGLKDQVSIISAQMHSATERLEALGKARDGDEKAAEKFTQMEGRLVAAAERLEAASLEAANGQVGMPAGLLELPSDMLTEQSLRNELGTFANSLGVTLDQSQNSMVERIDQSQASMVERIDQALERLDALTGQNEQMIEDVARRSAESAVAKMNASVEGTSMSPGGADTDTTMMQDDLDEIRHLADKLLKNNHNSFISVHSVLDGVVNKLSKLEERDGGIPVVDNANNADMASELQALRDHMTSMKTSTDDLSAETRSSFHSVQDILTRVSSRLEALEGAAPQPVSAFASTPTEKITDAVEVETEDDHLPLSEDLKTEAKPEVPVAKQPPSRDEVLQRMREHVKAREPDAPSLLPTDEDTPIEPGSGRPEFAVSPTSSFDQEPDFQRPDPVVDEYENDTPDDDDFTVEDQTAGDGPASKSDFIAAARRAAQAAAAEQALNIDDEPKRPKRSLSSIRDRINSVARGGRKSVLNDGIDNDGSDLSEPELTQDDPGFVASPSSDDDHNDWSPDKLDETADDLEQDLINNLSEDQPKKSKLRPLLMAAACVVLIGISGYLLRGPIGALVGNSPQSAAVNPLKQNVDKSPVTSKKVEPVQSAQPSADTVPSPGDQGPTEQNAIDLNASSLPPALPAVETELDNLNQSEIVDPSTTQSLPARSTSDSAELQSEVIANAALQLPRDKVSDKLSKAILESKPEALFEIARRYGDGDVFDRNLRKSAFWYKQSAARGSAIAMFRLGTLYEDGVGVPKSPQLAVEWYVKAANAGNARAMHNLAVMYAEGSQGRPDFKNAFNWFEKGANHGIKDSQFNVGILYVRGLGVKASLIDAYKWFDVVAKSGDLDATEKRDEIAKALTKEQLDEAKTKSAAYKAIPIAAEANVIVPPAFWQDKQQLGLENKASAPKKAAKKGSPQVKQAQALLNGLGFDTGRPDGLVGKKTRDAVRAFEYEIGMPQTGKVNDNLIQLLKSQKI